MLLKGKGYDSDKNVLSKNKYHDVINTDPDFLFCAALSLVSSSVVQNVALATWGHADSIVRVKLKKELPPWPVVRAPELDPVSMPLGEE